MTATAANDARATAHRIKTAGIQRFRLRFQDPELEAEFRASHNATYRRQTWIWCMAAIAVYSVLGAIEWLILPEKRELAFLARYGVAFVDFGIGFYLAFKVDYDRWFARSMPVSIAIVFLTTAFVYVQMPAGYRDLYLCQYVAAVLFLYLHMGLPFRVAAPLGLGACAAFAAFTLWTDWSMWVQRDLFPLAVVMTANLMAMFSAHDHELSNRRFFRAGKLLARQRVQEQELQERLAHASRQEAVGRLAGGVAHDFNNLLQVIVGSAAFALERTPAVGIVTEQLRLIRKTAQSGGALTRQLLAFSRQHAMAPMPCDLHALIGQYVPVLRRVLPETVDVVLHADAPRATVLADAGMIEQVLVNLAINARDAMPRGGTLTLRTGVTEPTPEFLRGRPWAKEAPYLVVSVADSGEGMTPEVLARAFEPFFTTKDVGSGTGLGLSMAYGILQQHGGMIEAESQPGKGATFRLYLPLHATEAFDAAPPPVLPLQPPQPGTAETLLLVEDNPDLCWVLSEMLRGQGYKVISALDGEQAWEAYRQHRGEIRLALLDVLLPKLNGYELFARIRALDPALPMIFTSGYTGTPTDTPPPGAEKVPLLRKPYKNETLYRVVREQLDRGRLALRESEVAAISRPRSG